MLGIEAPEHLLDLIPKSLILNKNCVEAAFDWLLERWSYPEETLGLDGVRLEQLYSTDQEEVRSQGRVAGVRVLDVLVAEEHQLHGIRNRPRWRTHNHQNRRIRKLRYREPIKSFDSFHMM